MGVPRKAISQKSFTGHCSGLIFEGLRHETPSRIPRSERSQSSLKPSKISPPPQNAIDIALRGMAIPGESLVGLTGSFASKIDTPNLPRSSQLHRNFLFLQNISLLSCFRTFGINWVLGFVIGHSFDIWILSFGIHRLLLSQTPIFRTLHSPGPGLFAKLKYT